MNHLAPDILHISAHDQRLKFPEQALHLFHIPIIKMSWKVRILATQLPALVASWHLLIFINRQ